MRLLDTNVISEMRKFKSGKADPAVQRWAKGVSRLDMYLSAITIFEMEFGILRLRGKDPVQGQMLSEWLHGTVLPSFAGRVIDVDAAIAIRCAALHVPANRSYRDSFIAATALAHGMTVVTRNTKDFIPMGVSVLNPWLA